MIKEATFIDTLNQIKKYHKKNRCIVVSFKSNKWWYILAHLINLLAFFKKRKIIVNHTAGIIYVKKDAFCIFQSNFFKNTTTEWIDKAYFDKYKGKIYVQVLPKDFTIKAPIELDYSKKYSLFKAMLSPLKLFKKEQMTNVTYCFDYVADTIEKATNMSLSDYYHNLSNNNAITTPAEFASIVLQDKQTKTFKIVK